MCLKRRLYPGSMLQTARLETPRPRDNLGRTVNELHAWFERLNPVRMPRLRPGNNSSDCLQQSCPSDDVAYPDSLVFSEFSFRGEILEFQAMTHSALASLSTSIWSWMNKSIEVELHLLAELASGRNE